MPKLIQYIDVVITDGVNYVIDETDNVLYYYITGTLALTSNWSMTIGAGATAGMRCHIQYNGNVTLAGNHIYILGTQVDDDLATKNFDAYAFYNGTSWFVRFFPDWEESGFVQTADIADDAVTNDKLSNIARGSVKVGGVSDAPTDLDAKSSGNILVGDGTDIKSVAMSNDATLASTGSITIADDAVTNTKLANISRGYIKVGGIADAPTDLNAKTNAQILIGNGTDVISVPVTGDVTITAAGVTTINPALLPGTYWEAGSAGTHSLTRINADTGCDATGDYAIAFCNNTTASGNGAISCGFATQATGNYSSSFGNSTIASGMNSHAENELTTASGTDSHAEGFQTIAQGSCSHASGAGTLASGSRAFASGQGTTASGSCSYAGGLNTVASGTNTFATGSVAIASGNNSISIGSNTTSSGATSIATGFRSVSNINYSRAFASGRFSIDGDAQKIDTILKLTTVDGAVPVADELQLADGTDGITIPTDCSVNIDIRLIAVVIGGTAGTIGDTAMQNIKLCAKNIAGVSSIVTHNGATLANYSTVAGDVLYELSSSDATFIGPFVEGTTVVASVAANKLHITVTGGVNQNIQWVAYVSMIYNGYRNFSI